MNIQSPPRVHRETLPYGLKRKSEDETSPPSHFFPSSSSSSSSSLLALNPREVDSAACPGTPKRPKAQKKTPDAPSRTARTTETPKRPTSTLLFLRLQDATCGSEPDRADIRRCAQALQHHTGGDLAVEPALRDQAFAHLIAAAKKLPAASATLFAEALGGLFGGSEIGGDCGGTLVMRLLDPDTALTAAQLTAVTQGLARAGILHASASPPVALCRLYMRLTGSLSREKQAQAMVELVKVFGQGPALALRCEALAEALGQRASSMHPIRVRTLVEGMARGIGGSDGLSVAQTTWLLRRLLATPGLEGDRLEAALQGVGRALGGADMDDEAHEQLADALAAAITTGNVAQGRIEAALRAVLKPRGEPVPGPQRGARLLEGLLARDHSPAWRALGATVAEDAALRQMLLQGLHEAPELALENLAEGMVRQVLRRPTADTPTTRPDPQGSELTESALRKAMDWLLQAAAGASHRQVSSLAEGLVRAVGKKHQLAMEASLKAAGATAPVAEFQKVRLALAQAFKGAEAGR